MIIKIYYNINIETLFLNVVSPIAAIDLNGLFVQVRFTLA